MTPYYEQDGITIYHTDCREVAVMFSAAAVVSDPPYGMAWNTDSSRFSGGQPSSRDRRGRGRSDWGDVVADDRPFDPRLLRVHQRPAEPNRPPIPVAVRAAVYQRDEFKCRVCGSGDDLTIDHVVPLARDGIHHESNFQTLCRSCNSRKGARV